MKNDNQKINSSNSSTSKISFTLPSGKHCELWNEDHWKLWKITDRIENFNKILVEIDWGEPVEWLGVDEDNLNIEIDDQYAIHLKVREAFRD